MSVYKKTVEITDEAIIATGYALLDVAENGLCRELEKQGYTVSRSWCREDHETMGCRIKKYDLYVEVK